MTAAASTRNVPDKRHIPLTRLVARMLSMAALSATLLVFTNQIFGSPSETFETRFRHGTEALRNGHLEEAAAEFSQCIALSPNSAEAVFNLALVRFQQGRWDEASALFSKALQQNPAMRGASLFLGIARYRLDQYGPASDALKRAIELEPSNPDALMWLGMAELASGETSSALASLQKAAELKPNNVDILYHLGRAYMALSKETYERMYQAEPTSWRVHQVLAQSFQEADRLDDAAKECKLAIEARPAEPGLRQLLGDIYWKGNHLEQAEAAYQDELKITPQNLTVMYDLATISIERSKPQVAAELLASVLKVHPESLQAHYQLGRAEAQLGNNDAAIQNFSAVVGGKDQADPEILRLSYYQLAQLYRRERRQEESRLAMNSFIRLKQQADAQQDQKLQDKLKRSTDPQSQ